MSSLSRWHVRIELILLWCTTLLTPLAIAPASITYVAGEGWSWEPIYFFIFGSYRAPGTGGPAGWSTGPQYMVPFFMFLCFFLIYALLVTHYCIRPSNRRGAIVIGLISLAIPMFLFGWMVSPEERLNGIYAGPLPFQFIIGLILMWVVKRGIKKPKDELLEERPPWWKESQNVSPAENVP